MKKRFAILFNLCWGGVVLSTAAEDFLQIYQKVKENNPELRISIAKQAESVERINQARGTLYPQIRLKAHYRPFHPINREGPVLEKQNGMQEITLGLEQVVFDPVKWKQLSMYQKDANVAYINRLIEQQNLILSTAKYYCAVLTAREKLELASSQKRNFLYKLTEITQYVQVGLAPITELHEASAAYDSAVANEVKAYSELKNSLEKLYRLTGRYYSHLQAMDPKDFHADAPGDINHLLKRAAVQNLNLVKARLKEHITLEQVRAMWTGHLPTITLYAQLIHQKYRKGNIGADSFQAVGSSSKTLEGGIVLEWPLFAGGQTLSKTKQAQYELFIERENVEGTHRAILEEVKTAFNTIKDNISLHQAALKALSSSRVALKTAEEGVKVGTQSFSKVLNARASVNKAELDLFTARYEYAYQTLKLKATVGILTEQDLVIFNALLKKTISIQQQIVPSIAMPELKYEESKKVARSMRKSRQSLQPS